MTSSTFNDVSDNMVYTTTANTGEGSSSEVQVISSMHMDYIHQIALDVYGRRMATCSGDRFVRVWELSDDQWILAAQWQAHRGSVSSLCWAHPEFGNLLATTGSSDHDAKIWEEMTPTASTNTTNSSSPITNVNSSFANPPPSSSRAPTASAWTLKASLTEARRALTCCEFAPRHWGLKLAAGSADGCVRIYEAVDIMNLAQWPLAATLQCFSGTDQDAVVGAGAASTSAGGAVRGVGGSSTASSALYSTATSVNVTAATSAISGANKETGCTSISWCTGRFEPPTLVAGGIHLLVYRYSEAARAWQAILQLPPINMNDSPPPTISMPSSHVLDVSWAPNVGRRFHYIAAAEEDLLRIYKLKRENQPPDDGTNSNQKSNPQPPGNMLVLDNIQVIKTNAWRCQWNVTGTVLASSGDGGIVQLWKADHHGRFGCVGKVEGDLSAIAKNTSNAMITTEDGQ